MAVNCSALPPNLLESELFGYVEGAFTGAKKEGKPGLCELAHGGTVFLDEIGDMDKGVQARILRVLEERQVMRIGSDSFIPVDIRVIAATHADLDSHVQSGSLRLDLFYRLNVLTLNVPPLRDRQGDIIMLARYFAQRYCQEHRKQIEDIPADIFDAFTNSDLAGKYPSTEKRDGTHSSFLRASNVRTLGFRVDDPGTADCDGSTGHATGS